RDAHAAPRQGAPGRDRDRDRRAGQPHGELGGGCGRALPALRPGHRGRVRGDGRAAGPGGRLRHPRTRCRPRGPDRGRFLRRDGAPGLTDDLPSPRPRLALQLPRPRATGDVSHPEAVRWSEDGRAVDILDQTRLPDAEVRLRIASAEEAAEAIRTLRVRGAPAIGVAAALALAVEMERWTDLPGSEFRARLEQARRLLASTRPTAVNLFWALERMARRAAELPGAPNDAVVRALR